MHAVSNIGPAFLRLFFYLLYHKFAWTYDWIARLVSFGSWQEWIATVLPHLEGVSILELGHGPGHLQVALKTHGKLAMGMDASWQMSRLAARGIKRKGLKPYLINGYAQYIPFYESAFDHVVATFPTEFIFQPQTLSEIKRVLDPHGTLVVLPVAVITGNNLSSRLLRMLYQITGQAPEQLSQGVVDRICRPFNQSGFMTETFTSELVNSQVLIIIAHPAIQEN